MQADDFVKLGAPVTGDGGNTHLGGDLVKTLVDATAVVGAGLGGVNRGDLAAADEIVNEFEGKVGIDGGGAIADEHGEVVRIPRRRRLHHDVGIAAKALADEPVMHRAGGEQGVNGKLVAADVAVRQHQHQPPVVDRLDGAPADVFDRFFERCFRRVVEIDALVAEGRLVHGKQGAELAL